MSRKNFVAIVARIAFVLTAVAIVVACSSDFGPGNLLAGNPCDEFSAGNPECACCANRTGACIPNVSPCAPSGASLSCGAPCPANLQCIVVNGRDVCGVPTACTGPATQSCGSCGSQSRTCSAGNWSDWGVCSGQGTCAPGQVQACGAGMTQVCTSACGWGACAAECSGNQTQTQACGNCGSQTRACNAGKWGPYGSCTSQGVCAPGATQACSDGGVQSCAASCQWGSCGGTQCQAGQVDHLACGNCGDQSRSCVNGSWGPYGACGGQGACKPGASQACGDGGTQSCSNICQWSTCSGTACQSGQVDTERCGNCGTNTRTCVNGNWTPFGTCTGQGVCAPGSTASCGSGGTETCNATCQYDLCTGQTCAGPYLQSCGVCGFETRTCSNGTWSNWSACMSERDCVPGSTRACTDGGAQSCNLQCYWDACL